MFLSKTEKFNLYYGKEIDMRVGTAIAIVMILLFFGLPILTGYAPFPTDPSPDHVGDFFGGIWDYWSEVFKVVSQRSKPTDQQTIDQQTTMGSFII
jgi:hypothetical protein